MSASVTTDKITEARKTTNPVVTTVSTSRSIAGTSLICTSLSGWPTNTAVHFITYKKTTAGLIDKSTQCDWKGIVSSNTIGTLTLKSGTDAGNAIGDFVEMGPTAAYAEDLAEALELEHTTAGVHNLGANSLITGSTITTPKLITSLNDTNGNELFKVTATGSAVNELTLANAATGNNPSLTASGGDTNVGINLVSKGTGEIQLNGTPISGAWQSWTPTWVGTTIGNATVVAKYKQIGKKIDFHIAVTLGSTTTIAGTGVNTTFSLPVTAVSSGYLTSVSIIGRAASLHGGTTQFGSVVYSSTTVAQLIAEVTTAATNVGTGWNSDHVGTTTGDTWGITGTIEAA